MKFSTKEILEEIKELGDRDVTKKFIRSLDLTSDQMEFLAYYDNYNVIKGLAQNPNLTSEKAMIKLSNEKNKWIRYFLAKNPNLTEDLMIKLANDEDYHIRYGLTRNPKITNKIIIKLSNDEAWDVKYPAFRKLKKLNSLKKEELEEAYDLIMESKYMKKEFIKFTFNYIADTFLELSELAKIYKKLILKLKKNIK